VRAVNLVPADQRGTVSAAGRSGGGAYAVFVVIGGLALLAFLYGKARHEVSDNQSKAASLTAKAQHAEAVAAQLAPYTSFIAVREQRVAAVSLLMDTRFDWAHSLHELGRVLPKGTSISSIDGTVGSSTASAGAKATGATGAAGASPASGSVASATPAGTVPTLTLNGCATSQAEVALTLQRLRLIDGVSEVKLQSSTKTEATATGPGSCASGDPAFIVAVAFDPLPTPSAPSGPGITLAADTTGAGSTSGVSATTSGAPR
jgi:Tfp pilus assembly protein PilN